MYPDFKEKINENSLFQLQQIARNRVIEPFEGRKSLETMQKTRGGIEKGISQVKKAGTKAGKWLTESKLVDRSKSKFSEVVQDIKKKSSSSSVSDLVKKIDRATEELQKITKSTYLDLEEKTKAAAISYVEKGLELLLYEDTEEWIVKRAGSILHRPDLNSLERIRDIGPEDRELLVQTLYPYDSPSYSRFARGFDVTLNVGLGAVVASNLPGTGLAVSLVNMGKTLVKMGNRLNIMSAIYGQRIAGPQALFKTSATILKSMDDWENNVDHTPLNPDILDDLYQNGISEDETAFQELMNAIARKEAYIAIPGVGMISLGKINLDDLKMDLVVQHLVQDYFTEKALTSQLGEKRVAAVLDDFERIYAGFLRQDYHKIARKQKEIEQLDSSEEKWKTRLKLLTGIDRVLKESSIDLDLFAKEIFTAIHGSDENEKERIVKEKIEERLKFVATSIVPTE